MSEILLIEDNPADILLTIEAFKECKQQHNIVAIKDGTEAMEYLGNPANRKPDLILLDLNLPKKDGRELLAEMKSDKFLRMIPVIILSTSRSEKDILTSYELRANCYICKPLELDNFIEVVMSLEQFWLNTVRLPDHKKNV